MRAIFIVILAIAGLLATITAQALTIASGGKSTAVIVIGQDATAPEKTAANELADYLNRITGGDFTVTSDISATAQTRIFVGQTAVVKSMLPEVKWSDLAGDGIIIKTKGNTLILAGDRPRGTLYAVYTFLEDYVGVRWWTYDSTFVPRKSTLRIKDIDLTYKPPFRYRETFYNSTQRAENADFAAHRKLNGHYQGIGKDKGGHYSFLGFCHTFNQLIPPAAYAQYHPDWFAMVNGKRTFETAQLCLTNDEMKKEFTRRALEWIKADPSAGIISLAQNDCAGACECDNCKALVAKTGSQSGALITFVNSVAEEIEKQYPTFLVETLAYQYTRSAPTNVKPRKNVLVRLCTIECDFSKPLDGPTNTDFWKDMQNWKKISPQLFVWDYVVNFNNLLIPHPNYQVLAKNIRLFEKNHVIGLFEQGDGYNPDATFAGLKVYVLSKLMWNPKLNQDKLTSEFLRGYYGEAGPYLDKYLKVVSDAIIKDGSFYGCGGTRMFYMTAADFAKAYKLFDQAEPAVKSDPVLAKRVMMQRVVLDHGYLTQRPFIRGVELETITPSPVEMAKRFLKVTAETGNVAIGEASPMPETYKQRVLDMGNREVANTDYRKPGKSPDSNYPNQTIIQEKQFQLAALPQWVGYASDSEASDGSAARMPGDHVQWAVQVMLKDLAGKKGELFVSVKVLGKAPKGKAFTTGIYSPDLRYEVVDRLIKLEDIPGKGYYDYSFGEITVTPDMYIYVAPCKNITGTEAVYVDKVVFVPSK